LKIKLAKNKQGLFGGKPFSQYICTVLAHFNLANRHLTGHLN